MGEGGASNPTQPVDEQAGVGVPEHEPTRPIRLSSTAHALSLMETLRPLCGERQDCSPWLLSARLDLAPRRLPASPSSPSWTGFQQVRSPDWTGPDGLGKRALVLGFVRGVVAIHQDRCSAEGEQDPQRSARDVARAVFSKLSEALERPSGV
jgi:hypothetical protein